MDNHIQQHDMTGIRCPMPIVQLSQLITTVSAGGELIVAADDPAFAPDIKAWCRRTGHELVALEERDGVTRAHLRMSA